MQNRVTYSERALASRVNMRRWYRGTIRTSDGHSSSSRQTLPPARLSAVTSKNVKEGFVATTSTFTFLCYLWHTSIQLSPNTMRVEHTDGSEFGDYERCLDGSDAACCNQQYMNAAFHAFMFRDE